MDPHIAGSTNEKPVYGTLRTKKPITQERYRFSYSEWRADPRWRKQRQDTFALSVPVDDAHSQATLHRQD